MQFCIVYVLILKYIIRLLIRTSCSAMHMMCLKLYGRSEDVRALRGT